MTAYMRIVLLRLSRGRDGPGAVLAALGAPLFFATLLLLAVLLESPQTTDSAADISTATVFFSVWAAGCALTHVIVTTINIEKQKGRIGLLRSSGFAGVRPVISFFLLGGLLAVVLTPLAMLGHFLMAWAVDLPPVRPSLVLTETAAVLVVAAVAATARLLLMHWAALGMSYSSVALLAATVSLRQARRNFSVEPVEVLGYWLLMAAVVVLLVAVLMLARQRGAKVWA